MLRPVQGFFLPVFLSYSKKNKRKEDKRGTLPDIYLATTEKERKANILQCILLNDFDKSMFWNTKQNFYVPGKSSKATESLASY